MNINFSRFSTLIYRETKEQLDRFNKGIKEIFGCCFEREPIDETSQLGQVPLPIQHHILSFLTEEELVKLGLASKYWHSMTSTYTLSTIISQDRVRDLPKITLPETIRADGTDSKNNLLLKKSGAQYSNPSIGEVLEIKDLKGHGLCHGKDPWGRFFLAAHYALDSKEEGLITIEQERPNNGFKWKVTYTGNAKLHLLSNWKTNTQIRDFMKKLLQFETCGMPVCRNYQFTADSALDTIKIKHTKDADDTNAL